jgi:hypothetical protein
VPTPGSNLLKILCLIAACCTAARDCTYVEEKIMKRLGLALSVVAMTYATTAVSDQLKGTYGFTGTGICLYALPDFLTNVGVPFVAPRIGVHVGSHGLGHTSAARDLEAVGGKDGMSPAVIDQDTEIVP